MQNKECMDLRIKIDKYITIADSYRDGPGILICNKKTLKQLQEAFPDEAEWILSSNFTYKGYHPVIHNGFVEIGDVIILTGKGEKIYED